MLSDCRWPDSITSSSEEAQSEEESGCVFQFSDRSVASVGA